MELLSLAAFASAVVSLVIFSLRFESAQQADIHVLDWLQRKLAGSTGKRRRKIDTLMRDVTALGGDTATVLLALTGSAALLSRDDSSLLAPFLLTLAVGRGAGWLLKKLIRRPRPTIAADTLVVFTSSFPSVHTAMGFVSSFAIVFFLASAGGAPCLAIGIASLASALIGSTRLYFAVHWPSDILAGWFAGLAIAAISAYMLTA